AHYQCLTFDNRGLGRSQPPGGTLSIGQMAADALALMDGAGWSSAHVVGHSMGGIIAQQLALTARPRVRSLSLLCTFARGREATRLTPGLFWIGLRTRVGTRRQRRRAFLRFIAPPEALARMDADALAARLAPWFGHDLADQPAVVMKQLAALRACDLASRLGELAAVPTLVVSAAQDPLARPESGRALASGIPGARYVELSDASHGVPLLEPGRINDLLLDHLARVEAARPAGA
ncbi:MAG TPA: alpha/beta fold hydrolase, partial [Methylomirabilota bacterium]|nr:alpha/beta fold hydrolase [Methylomirabilota bacterium]